MAFAYQTHIETPRNAWVRGLTNLSTEGDEVDPTNSLSKPYTVDSTTTTANKVVRMCDGNHMFIALFGTDANNETFTGSIYVWSAQVDLAYQPPRIDYVPSVPEITFTATLGAKVGVASGVLSATEYYADTIVPVTTYTPTSRLIETYSPANDGEAWMLLDTTGILYVEIQFDLGTAASAGALTRTM